MLKTVYYYIDKRGRNPVREFIDNLPLKEQAKIFAYITELRSQGHRLLRPMAGYLENGVYELRPGGNRIFYFFFLRENAVLVHAIRKQTNRIPREDLALCLKRKNEIEVQESVIKLEM